MTVFRDNHFKCWACGEYGDPIDFIQKLHGLTFKESLQHLGIEQGPITAEMRKRITKAEHKRKKKQAYEQRRRNLLYTLAVEIRKARKVLTNVKNECQMELVADLFNKLSYWQHCHEVLIHGEHQDVQAVMDELKGLKLINRRSLFKPDFEYRQWVRDFTHERTINAI
jgi:hypothetical protein